MISGWSIAGLNLDRDRSNPPVPGTARTSLLVKYTHSFGT